MRVAHALLTASLAAACLAPIACTPDAHAGGGDTGARDPARCATCHMPDYLATSSPVHKGAKPTACGVCHASTSWHPSRLEHPFWALTGAHPKAACFDCHRGAPPVFHGTSKACVTCHRAEFDRAMFPDHATFALTCEECHTTTVWKPSTWKTLPTAPASASSEPPAIAKPVPTGVRRPRPRPSPSAAPTSSTPDVVTHPSRR